jgi:hypothetical protein
MLDYDDEVVEELNDKLLRCRKDEVSIIKGEIKLMEDYKWGEKLSDKELNEVEEIISCNS